ncbi:multidrug efflux MFS transporter [Agromyces intestinalis]|uniref:Multidrug efflux MFS transporter n=1 Tax=Agromyces intestinalis TaxID=2592652 RepID=A0A5C1YHB1_9MICO|nr:multidrug efflux MFS transporter [Agromyces intestinalis]
MKSDTSERRAIVTALVLVVGGLAVIFDSTIVSIALDTLASDLHVPVSTIQWVSTGYLLALAVTIPVVAWGQARIGGKRLWMIALTVFLVASVLCSLAWDAPSLIAFRVLQGLGGGLMMPLMATLAMQQVAGTGVKLGKLMAVVSLPAALGPILGPTLGGVILTWLDWHWLFWVNVPFCLVGLLLAWRMLPADVPTVRAKLDVVGLLLLSPALVGVLYGLSNAGRDGGFGRFDVVVPLAVGAVLLVAFVVVALRRAGAALVDVRLFARRAVGSSSTVLFLSGATLFGSMLLLPLYFQNVRGETALVAGLLLIPQGVGTLVSRTLAGRLTDRIGARWVAIGGFVLTAVATVPFALADASTNGIWLLAVLFVRGVGLGAVMIPVMSVAYVGIDRSDVPHASILTRLAQQLGGAFGTAILAVILEAGIMGAGSAAEVAAGFDTAFWWLVGFTAIAMVVALVLPGRAPGQVEAAPEEAAPDEAASVEAVPAEAASAVPVEASASRPSA